MPSGRFIPLMIAGILLATSIAPAPAFGAEDASLPAGDDGLAPAKASGGWTSSMRSPPPLPPQPFVPPENAAALSAEYRDANGTNQTFYTYETMTEELQRLADEHPNIVQLYDLTSWIQSRPGFKKTWQGRIVWGVRVSSSPKFNDPERPKVIIECSHHAREWMGFMTGMALVEVLVHSYRAKDDYNCTINVTGADWSAARLSWLVDNRDIWVIPMVNPDGTTMDQQMMASGSGSWRKNLRDNNNNGAFDSNYDGVDLNRNHPWMWCHNTKGVVTINGVQYTQDSSYPGSEQYHGPQDNYDDDGDSMFPNAPDLWRQRNPSADWNGIDEDPMDGIDNDGDGKSDEDWDGGLSEPETSAVAALFEALDSDEQHINGHSDISIAVSLHAYTGCVMWPWGYTYGPAPHAALLEEIGRKMASYSGYDAYQSANMYLTSGDTSDWFYAAMGTLPFCIELGKGSDQGFHPKPSMIDNISMPNVQSLLYCAEIADVAKVAFDLTAPSINLSIPRLEHTPRKEVAAGTELTLGVNVQNASSLAADGLRLLYRVKGGGWSSAGLKRVGEGRYSGSVPGQPGGAVLEYYFRARDTYNTTHTSPSYAPYDIYTTRVTGISGGALTWGGVAVVVLVACLALVWRFKRHWFPRLRPQQKK